MSKLLTKEFNTQQELTNFVNSEKIQREEIVSINSDTHQISYWSYVDEIEKNKERNIEYNKFVDDFYRRREKKY